MYARPLLDEVYVHKVVKVEIYSVADMAAAVRGRRLDLGLSQRELAHRAGVSREWVNQFEAGKPTAQLFQILKVLQTLGYQVALGDADENASERVGSGLDAFLAQYRQ